MTEQPGYGPEQLVRELSLPRRVGYVVAGLGGGAGSVIIGWLWATEPVALPVRTQVAFAAMIMVGAAWAGFATWALARHPLFALDRVIAAGLALLFSTVVTVGTTTIALVRGSVAGVLVGGALGLAMIVAAGVLLARARAYRRELHARRRELEGRPHQGTPR
ncbi:MAG TPA: hypothetical protein VF755_15820 [Catenuloplanes sp.]|jgi:hypothetical protein